MLRNLEFQLERELITEREKLIQVEKYLDQGIGNCYLRQPEIAEIVEENILKFADIKYNPKIQNTGNYHHDH